VEDIHIIEGKDIVLIAVLEEPQNFANLVGVTVIELQMVINLFIDKIFFYISF